ncbi:uncharacterized protein [Spinacia oleracea]|uniref:Uncharacterized protein isoform X4 n=1 Tax=Spinacia oleracea TaxID=3562 RepID=A0ABM3R5I8_SPIOL|nr:uncharacterized protein LOC110782815 isoform X4 [Spinacia oleracea]
MSSGNDEVSIQPKEGDIESQNKRLPGMGIQIEIETGQAVLNLKHLKKSIEILRSALKIFTSNTKFILLMQKLVQMINRQLSESYYCTGNLTLKGCFTST